MDIPALYRAVAAVCPIEGVSIGVPTDKATWRIDYLPAATDAQRAAAQSVVGAFDVNADPPAIIDGTVFLSRVTDAEYANVMTSAASNVAVARWIDTLRMKGFINLGDPVAQSAKAGLVALGLFTQARADVLFAP